MHMVHAHAQRSTSQVTPFCPLLKKMMGTARYVVLLLARALVVSALLADAAAPAAAAEYVRPPPRPIILTEHTEPATHPQQVHVSAVGARHMRCVDHRRQARAVRGGVRQGLPELHRVGRRRPHVLPLLPLLLRQDPPRQDRPAGARHRVLLPVRHGRQRVQPQDAAGGAAHRARPRRGPGADGMDGVDAGAREQDGLRHAAGAGGPVVRRHAAAAVGHVRAVRAEAREPAAVDGDAGQPRGGGGAAAAGGPGLAAPVRRLRRALADAARGQRLAVQPLLLLRRGRRRRARRHAGLLRPLRRQLRPVPVAGAGPRGRGPARHALARRAAARALVQHQRGAPGRGRRHEEGPGAAALPGPRRRRLRRPRPCLRALHKGVRQRGEPVRTSLHHHWRWRQQRRTCLGL